MTLLRDALTLYREANPPRLFHITIVETMIADLLLDMGMAEDAETHIRIAL